MLPLGHAALAYLSYVGIAGLTRRPLPVHWALVPLGVASQLPDLVDKPLSYHGLIISGRSLGHSLVTAIVLVVLVWLAARWVARAETGLRARLAERTPLAFAVGYLSHLSADALYPVLLGEGLFTWFLFWPLTPVPAHGTAPPLATVRSFAETFVTFLGTPRGTLYVLGELALLAGAVLLWLRDGVPGLPVGRPA